MQEKSEQLGIVLVGMFGLVFIYGTFLAGSFLIDFRDQLWFLPGVLLPPALALIIFPDLAERMVGVIGPLTLLPILAGTCALGFGQGPWTFGWYGSLVLWGCYLGWLVKRDGWEHGGYHFNGVGIILVLLLLLNVALAANNLTLQFGSKFLLLTLEILGVVALAHWVRSR
jgi:hypothetical protein